MQSSLIDEYEDPTPMFSVFKGNLEEVCYRITSTTYPTVPTKHSSKSGLMMNIGIDLGVCTQELYLNHLQLMFTETQDRILQERIGWRGKKENGLSYIRVQYFDGTTQSTPDLTIDQRFAIIKSILHHHWSIVCKREGGWVIESSAQIQSILLSWLFDYGSSQTQNYQKFIEVIKTGDVIKIASHLHLLSVETDSIYWSGNRRKEISSLIDSRLQLSDVVDSNTPLTASDVSNLDVRLVELGFESILNNTTQNMSSIERFSTYVGAPSTTVTPGDMVHIWLSCQNAPSHILLQSQNIGLQINATDTYVCNWLSQTLNASGQRLQKMNQVLSAANESYFGTSIVVDSISPNGMGVEIKLPSKVIGQDVNSADSPHYDRDGMKRILQSLLSDGRIHGGDQLHLNDSALASEGLCKLIGERREDPSDNDSPKFKKDFIDENDWDGANLSPDRLHLLIVPDQITDAVSLDIQQNQRKSSLAFEQVLDEVTHFNFIPPVDEAGQFDYYMGAIRTFHPNVVDPAEGIVELLGIAGWSDGGVIENTRNRYNDMIFQIWVEGSQKHVKGFKASTAPGHFSNFYNTKGDAHLMKCSTGTTDGRYRYKVGKHKGYTALNQAEDFKVWRDKDKDGIQKSTSLVESGRFGINLHAGGVKEKVGNWSAGCQIIWGGKTGAEWTEFIGRLDGSTSKHTDAAEIHYTLINGQDMPIPAITQGGSS